LERTLSLVGTGVKFGSEGTLSSLLTGAGGEFDGGATKLSADDGTLSADDGTLSSLLTGAGGEFDGGLS